jgi:N-hydroxyarylamine O-acetyltransferase
MTQNWGRAVDFDAYFARIGWEQPFGVDFATLAGLLEHHMTRIPFENLDVMLKRQPKLDIPSLQQKLVGEKRGGYCYEHATLFCAVLEQLGFDVAMHSARVTMLRPISEAPRTHMFLTVTLAGAIYVVDPGFGGLAPRVPVSIDGTVAVDHWISRDADRYVLMARTLDKDVTAWVSTLERDFPIDFEMANYFTATSSLSPFTRGLMMRAFTPDGRVTIRNRTFTHVRGIKEEVRTLESGAELRVVTREHFGFDLPELETFELPA